MLNLHHDRSTCELPKDLPKLHRSMLCRPAALAAAQALTDVASSIFGLSADSLPRATTGAFASVLSVSKDTRMTLIGSVSA